MTTSNETFDSETASNFDAALGHDTPLGYDVPLDNGTPLDPVTPGELLKEEFLVPMGITQRRLARETGVSAWRIGQIVKGRRAVTADTDERLCRFFGLSEGYWLRAQAACDAAAARA